MRNLIIVFTSLFIFCTRISGQQKCKLNVGSLNLRYDNKGDKGDSWVHHKGMAASLVHLHDSDVFEVQEGLTHQVEDLVKDDTYTSIGIGRDDRKGTGEHATVLFKKGRSKLLDSGDYWLSETRDKPFLGWDAQCRGVCSWTKLRDKVSGKEPYFFSVHFNHTGEVARHEFALTMLTNTKKIVGDSPAICVGDFNDTPNPELIQMLKSDGLLLDSREILRIPSCGTIGTTNQFSLNAPMKNQTDYISATRNIRVNKYGMLDEFRYGHYPPDHFPIMVEAEF